MARALGLAGCDYQQEPFRHKRRYTPTQIDLMNECKRRMRIMGVVMNRRNRCQYPSSKCSADALAEWLRTAATHSDDEAKELTSIVAVFKKETLQAQPLDAPARQDNGQPLSKETQQDDSSGVSKASPNKNHHSIEQNGWANDVKLEDWNDLPRCEVPGDCELDPFKKKASSRGRMYDRTLWEVCEQKSSTEDVEVPQRTKHEGPGKGEKRSETIAPPPTTMRREQTTRGDATSGDGRASSKKAKTRDEASLKRPAVGRNDRNNDLEASNASALMGLEDDGNDERKLSSCEKYYLQQRSQDQAMVVFLMAIGLVCCQGMVTAKLHCDQDPIKPSEQDLAREAQRRHRTQHPRREGGDSRPEPTWGVDGLMEWLQRNPIEGNTNIEFIRRTMEFTYLGTEPDVDEIGDLTNVNNLEAVGTATQQDRSSSCVNNGQENGRKDQLQRLAHEQKDKDTLSCPGGLSDVLTDPATYSETLLDGISSAETICSDQTKLDVMILDGMPTTLSITESGQGCASSKVDWNTLSDWDLMVLASDSVEGMLDFSMEETCDGGVGSAQLIGCTDHDVDGSSCVASLDDTTRGSNGGDGTAKRTAHTDLSLEHERKPSAQPGIGFTKQVEERDDTVKETPESLLTKAKSASILLPGSELSGIHGEWSRAGADFMDVSSLEDSIMKMSLSSSGAGSGSKQSTLGWSSSNPSTLSSSQDTSRLTADSKDLNRMRGGGAMLTLVEDEALETQGAVFIDVDKGLQTSRREKDREGDETVSNLSETSSSVLQVLRGKDVADMVLRDKQGRIGTYTGACSRFPTFRRVPHGKGRMKYHNDGMRYDGEWSKGLWHGVGVVHAKDNHYSGEFREGLFSGHGVRVWSNGSEYEGSWKDGMRSGNGTFRNSAGDVFDGTWMKDVMEGPGIKTFVDGSQYEGHFERGLEKGLCKYRDYHGRRHEGEWVSNRELMDGSLYNGLWKDGKENGFGRCFYWNGDVYEGQYDCGVPHGQGRWRSKHGDFYEGSFIIGKREGYGELVHFDGSRYAGEWKNNKQHGKGDWKRQDGDAYDGEHTHHS